MTESSHRCDYEENPDRFRMGRDNVRRFGLAGDIHEDVALKFAHEGSGFS